MTTIVRIHIHFVHFSASSAFGFGLSGSQSPPVVTGAEVFRTGMTTNFFKLDTLVLFTSSACVSRGGGGGSVAVAVEAVATEEVDEE